jgi:Glycosyl hydrolases family 2, TIM barrel domain/Glycosyl hydrolases family 2, sugar binding domain/Glycosyl hydrolases family 2/Beta galactosidase small chain
MIGMIHPVRRHFQLAALTSICCLLTALTPASGQETQRQLLSGPDAENPVAWEFRCSYLPPADADKAAPAGEKKGKSRKPKSPAEAIKELPWTQIDVPACWELKGFGKLRYGFDDKKEEPILGQYRKHFTVPADWQGKRIFVVFDGVMTDATVKVNGNSAGPVHQGAFYRFKYDITRHLKVGADNVLEVSVQDRSENDSVNAAERTADYWVFGGIYRPVWLQAEPEQYVDRVAIDARADGAFSMDFFTGGEGKADAVAVSLMDPRGKAVGEPVTVPLSAKRVTTTLAQPETWSAETPVLYTALIQLKQGTTVLHEMRQRFGFRTVEIRLGEGLFVNGHRVLLRGICHHVAWPTLGRASSPRIAKLDLDLIQEMNANAVRMTHYPPDQELLEMCDERGLYVLDELGGWHGRYETDIGTQLLKEMLARDVNHPSILMWDNGNEGGWNTRLDSLFTKLDPQKRQVVHPWAKLGDLNTFHYPDYKQLIKLLSGSDDLKEVVMPTEFLHGLYDGGHGAGLEDYWQAMRAAKNSAGGFLWVFADEGIQRPSQQEVDVNGNFAPDGIVGPYRQKEGSFSTIREIWSPVRIPRALPEDFRGALTVENRYEVTNLNRCSFHWEVRRFASLPAHGRPAIPAATLATGDAQGPMVEPGQTGTLQLNLPTDCLEQNPDALSITVKDYQGRELWTQVYPLQPQNYYSPVGIPVDITTENGTDVLKTETATLHVQSGTNSLLGVTVGDKDFSLRSGPLANARWTALNSGWFRLDYTVNPAEQKDLPGVAFDYPEDKMLKKTWLGDGPFRVWKNRQVGGTLGVWETAVNKTATGYQEWNYPEFAGYFSGVRWLRLTTMEGVLTLAIPDQGKFVRIGTPAFPDAALTGKVGINFPQGNIAVVGDLPAIGNKFHTADQTGPQATTPLATQPYTGTVFLKFESP